MKALRKALESERSVQYAVLTVSDRFFLGCGCWGADVGVAWAAVVDGDVAVSGCVAVAAVGGALLWGVLVGVVGEVGAVGLAVLALYMGALCLNWPGSVEAAAPLAVDSSGCRFVAPVLAKGKQEQKQHKTKIDNNDCWTFIQMQFK